MSLYLGHQITMLILHLLEGHRSVAVTESHTHTHLLIKLRLDYPSISTTCGNLFLVIFKTRNKKRKTKKVFSGISITAIIIFLRNCKQGFCMSIYCSGSVCTHSLPRLLYLTKFLFVSFKHFEIARLMQWHRKQKLQNMIFEE